MDEVEVEMDEVEEVKVEEVVEEVKVEVYIEV